MADQVRIVITATDKTDGAIKSVEGRLEALGSRARDSLQSIATGAGIATAAIALMGNNAIQAFAEMDRNLKSLDAVERGFMGTTGTLAVKAKELQDQFFGLSATGGALRNLISSGLGAEEAAKLIDVFKDRAILLGNAAVPLEQRLINLSQAFKTEQSELGDASGLTENFSQIVARGSEIVGKNADEMTKAERAHAKYAAIVELSIPFTGQAAEATKGLTGDQASLQQEVTRTTQAVGGALAPAYQTLLGIIQPLVQRTREYAEENPNAVMALTTIAGGATAATAAVAGLSAALLALRAATGGIGLVVAGIAAAAGALAGLVVASEAANRKQSEQQAQTATLMREVEGLRKVLDDTTTSTEKKEIASERLKGTLSKLFELQPQMKGWFDTEGKLLDGATEKWEKYRNAVVNAQKVELRQAITAAERDLDEQLKQRTDIENKIRNSAGGTAIEIAERELKADPNMDAATRQRYQDAIDEAKAALADEIILQSGALDAKVALLEAKIAQDKALLDALNEPVDPNKLVTPPPTTNPSPGGKPPDPYKDALRYMEFLKNTGRLTAQQEIAMLEEIQRVHVKDADDRMDIEERIYQAKQKLSEKETEDAEKTRAAKLQAATSILDHQLRMNQASTADEIKRLTEILETYELTEEEERALLERRAAAQQRYAEEVAGAVADQMEAQTKAREASVKGDIDSINHRQRMGQLSRDQEIAAIEQHLQTWAGYYKAHTDELWSLEERLYSLKEQGRQEDLRKAQEAERERVESVEKAEQAVLKAIASAEKDALKAMKERHSLAESALQREISLAEERLKAYGKQIAAEDRLKKLQEAQRKVDELRAQQNAGTGDGEWVLGPGGSRTWRVRGLVEAEKQLEEIKTENQRAEERERLQSQAETLRAQLANLKDANQAELEAHQTYWESVKTVAEIGFAQLADAEATQMAAKATKLQSDLGILLGHWQTYANQVKAIMDGLGGGTPPAGAPSPITPPPALPGAPGAGTLPNWANIGANIIGAIVAPTMPKLAGISNSFSPTVQVQVSGASDPQATGNAVAGAVGNALRNAMQAFRQGVANGQTSG